MQLSVQQKARAAERATTSRWKERSYRRKRVRAGAFGGRPPDGKTHPSCADQTFSAAGLAKSDHIYGVTPPGVLGNTSITLYHKMMNICQLELRARHLRRQVFLPNAEV
jgi:hypothetical protein